MTDRGEDVPRLQRFYGGNIDWLSIPFELFNAYAVMLPILRAEESLERITENAIGRNLKIKSHDFKLILKDLHRQASERKHKRVIPQNIQNAMLASMGIAVVDVRKKKAKDSPQRRKVRKGKKLRN